FAASELELGGPRGPPPTSPAKESYVRATQLPPWNEWSPGSLSPLKRGPSALRKGKLWCDSIDSNKATWASQPTQIPNLLMFLKVLSATSQTIRRETQFDLPRFPGLT